MCSQQDNKLKPMYNKLVCGLHKDIPQRFRSSRLDHRKYREKFWEDYSDTRKVSYVCGYEHKVYGGWDSEDKHETVH